jgi:apolipoprotein N-acyltransferase
MRAVVIHALPFLSGFLFWASFHPLNLGFLAWGALVPLIAYARRTRGWIPLGLSWLAGAGAFTAGFFWVRYTVPAGPYLLGLYNGLYFAFFVAIVRRLGALWSAAAWTGLEYARGTLFGGLPWFLLGYTQHEALRIVQIADLGGVWLVSALVAFVNAAFVDGRRAARGAAAAALAGAFLYGAARLETLPREEGPRVAVVQPNIPQSLKELSTRQAAQALENYSRHVELTRRVSEEKPDLILWPEAAIYYGLEWDAERGRWVRDAWYRRVTSPAVEAGAPTVIGLLVVERGPGREFAFTNSAVYVDREGGIVGRYDKVHLVPFAEFIPLARTFPWIRDLVRRWSGLYLADMRAGEDFPLWEAAGERFGTQICFEAIFPGISRAIARKGARFTVNISNDGWFRDSAELDQMLAMARFRAIENRMHVIRATNTGISALIEPSGRLQAAVEEGGRRKEVEGTLAERIVLTRAGSLFRAVGDMAGILAAGASLAALAGRIFVDRKIRRA